MRFPLRHDDIDPRLNELGEGLVECIGDVRRELGAGLMEGVYLDCLAEELRQRGVPCEAEVRVPLVYKGRLLGRHLRLDLLVGGEIVVEGKAVDVLHATHFAQLLTYLRLADKPLGYLVNFNAVPLADGIHRRLRARRIG